MHGPDIIIIGAGISGLSLAHYCAGAGLKPLVLEKSGRVGGAFHSHFLKEEDRVFWLELGAHTCYNSYGNLLGIIEDCGILDRLVGREKVPFKMLVGDKVKTIPSQISFIELFKSVPRIFSMKKSGQTVESYYSKIVGKKNYEKVFAPLFNAVPSQRTNDFPADVLFKKRPRRKDIMKSFTLTQGLQTITNKIAARPEITTLTETEAYTIARDGDHYHVTAAGGNSFDSPLLALATPAPVTAHLLGDLFPEVAETISRIGAAKVESVGVAVRRDRTSLKPAAGIVPRDDSFFSVVSRDTVPHDDYRGFTFHFKPGLLDRESKISRISQVLGTDREHFADLIYKENIVPTLGTGHNELIEAVDRLIAGTPLCLTGNYFSGMAIEDCVSRSQSEFLRLKESSS